MISKYPGSNANPTSSDRQKRIQEHLARSTGDFVNPGPRRSEQRKQQILDHVRRTRG